MCRRRHGCCDTTLSSSAPFWQVEDPKRALILYGHKTSQVVKDVLTDIHKLKGVRGQRGCTRRSCFGTGA